MKCSVICLLVVSLMGTILSASKSKHVTVNLDAKWRHTPIILETSEFIAKEGNPYFWRYVRDLLDLEPTALKIDTEEDKYELALNVAKKILSVLQYNMLKLALSLRAHSPAIEMCNQISIEKKPPPGCEAFVEVHNMITCEMGALKAFIKMAKDQPKPTLVTNDHIYPGSEGRDVIVILYAEMGKPSFTEWHETLSLLASEGQITYILRHFTQSNNERKVRLSGYGVELAIKSQEYKATDDTKLQGNLKKDEDDLEEVEGFLFSVLKENNPDLSEDLQEFKQHLLDSALALAPLKVWQLQDLSFQAAQTIISANPDDQLRTLRDLSQNFPIMARSLIKTTITDGFRKEVQKNQDVFMNSQGMEPGDSALFINGLQAHLDVYDMFTLLETMRSEAKLMEGLYELANQYDISGQKMMELLKLELHEAEVKYAVDIRHDSIMYVNNLEKDKRYAGWPGSVQDILRPAFPGMMRHARKNFFNVIFMVNPADKQHKELLKTAEGLFVHNAPVRIGFLFVAKPDLDDSYDAGVVLIRAFNYIAERESPAKALSFITDVLDLDGDAVTIEDVVDEFSERPYKASDIQTAINTDTNDYKLEDAVEYFDRTGLSELPQVLVNGAPMKQHELDPDMFEESVASRIMDGTQALQTAVYKNQITDRTDILEYLMTQNNVVTRLNSRILSKGTHNLDLTQDISSTVYNTIETFAALDPAAMSAAMLSNMKYLSKKDDGSTYSVTNWVVGDMNTPEGRYLLYSAIKHLKHSSETRIGLIHNPSEMPGSVTDPDNFIPHAIQTAMETLDPTMAKSFVTKLLKEENIESLKNGEKELEELAVYQMDFAAYDNIRQTSQMSYLNKHRTFVEKVLGFKAGERGVICNGKVIGPLMAGEQFIQEDFDLLDKYTDKSTSGKVEAKINQFNIEDTRGSDLVMRVCSLLSVSPKDSRKNIAFWEDKKSVIKLPPADPSLPAYEIVAILDPLTRAAQKYAPILMVLQSVANVDIKIYFSCRDKLSEIPLKSFYRFVLEPELKFTVDRNLTTGPIARFQDMPESPVLTLGMEPPDSWLVEAVRTPCDLDNIHLEELHSSVHANFELDYLLLEGHCYDSVNGQPPRGLQFILGTNTTEDMVDTIVMANLGYFQLKAKPGVWNLRLRPGRSLDIYEIIGHELTDSMSKSSNVIAVIDSFKSKIIRIKVNKKPGMEAVELLDEEEPQKGLWDSISSKLTGTGTSNDDDVINIFSVASGHLYERLLRIMTLSVMKHTKSRVKFWFLQNFLSPTFKDFIPHLAKEYNFEYELVQYKWPRWLHQQTEKQRMIWGYKILFLDVLFPLSVNKILFVDADQIVRADLKELMDFDLEGAPYGYTPFCDSRKEMDGFRFWRSGYWASHLAGRKYHISALYVVDLKKFRKIAAGDRLRGQYQGLSQDPNSLSNLDQDLPNNMIHQVAIKSLPQEWLYCDTWCSPDTLKYAKTIDLCNNPKTKEPKLVAAARIAPEWTDYDQEVKLIWDQIYGTSTAANSDATQGETTDSSKDEL